MRREFSRLKLECDVICYWDLIIPALIISAWNCHTKHITSSTDQTNSTKI